VARSQGLVRWVETVVTRASLFLWLKPLLEMPREGLTTAGNLGGGAVPAARQLGTASRSRGGFQRPCRRKEKPGAGLAGHGISCIACRTALSPLYPRGAHIRNRLGGTDFCAPPYPPPPPLSRRPSIWPILTHHTGTQLLLLWSSHRQTRTARPPVTAPRTHRERLYSANPPFPPRSRSPHYL